MARPSRSEIEAFLASEHDPALYLLLGFPGTGKYTVAQALAADLSARGSEVRLVDNHYVDNPIFGIIPTDGETPLPEGIWGLIEQVRGAILTAIEEHAPPAWSFIFTNYITAQEAGQGSVAADYLDRLDRLASRRGCNLNIVRLTCEVDELCRRVANPERRERLKTTSADWAREAAKTYSLYMPAGTRALTLDTTRLSPPETARSILEHFG